MVIEIKKTDNGYYNDYLFKIQRRERNVLLLLRAENTSIYMHCTNVRFIMWPN